MGRVKQASIDNLDPGFAKTEKSKLQGSRAKSGVIDDISSFHPDSAVKERFMTYGRVYMVDGVSVPSDIFIGQVAAAMYNHTCSNDFRETIDILCADEDGREMITLGGRNFWSFIDKNKDSLSEDEMIMVTPNKEEERPLKFYEVSYDIEIIPTVPKIFVRGKKWKRTSVGVQASSFKEAKERVRTDLAKRHPEQKTKNFEVNLADPNDFPDGVS